MYYLLCVATIYMYIYTTGCIYYFYYYHDYATMHTYYNYV